MTLDPFRPATRRDLDPLLVREEVRRFLREDVGSGDVTTAWTIPRDAVAKCHVVARQACVVAGLDLARAAFTELDARVTTRLAAADGEAVAPGRVLLLVAGPAGPILTAERVALNLLQRLSGIATVTRRYVDAVAGTGASVSDTRKTTPGFRVFEKYAVRMGGGRNHRAGLYDAVLIKDNHLAAAGGIRAALEAAAAHRTAGTPIQVEVDDFDQLADALRFGVDAVLLDNMSPEGAAQAVALIRASPEGRACWVEASGGITLANVRRYAESGVDTVSVGAITHSAPAADIALDFDRQAL
jgi:nicotinate-nucleotide pyrophosphorylase (carboxylating)